MAKRILAVLMAALVCLMSMAACGSKLTIGTGGTGGTYYAFGGVLGQYIKKGVGMDCVPVATDGSKANIQGIDAGDYQLGTVQSDVMALQCSCLENPRDGGAWWAAVYGVAQSRTRLK